VITKVVQRVNYDIEMCGERGIIPVLITTLMLLLRCFLASS